MKVIPVMNYATPRVAEVDSKKRKEVDFGAAQPAKVASHSGHKLALALAIPALAIAAIVGLSSCKPAIDPGSTDPIVEPEKPENPSQSPVASAMQSIFNVLKVGSPTKSASASLVSKNAYAPVTGDVTAISYHDDWGNCTASYTLDTSKSTSDALVYNAKSVDDNFGIETNDVCTVTKTATGVKYNYESDGTSFDYVVNKDGYVMVYVSGKDGVQKEYERQYPGDTANTVKITAPDGTNNNIAASTLSNYAVTYAQ